jgi:hypothetical protein
LTQTTLTGTKLIVTLNGGLLCTNSATRGITQNPSPFGLPFWPQIPFALTNLLPHASIKPLTLLFPYRLPVSLPTRWLHPQFSPIGNPQQLLSSAFISGNNLTPILQTYGRPDITIYLDHTFRQPFSRTSSGFPLSSTPFVPDHPTRHPHQIPFNALNNNSDHHGLLPAFSRSSRPLQPPTQVCPTCSVNKIEVNSLPKNPSLAPEAPTFPTRPWYYLTLIHPTHFLIGCHISEVSSSLNTLVPPRNFFQTNNGNVKYQFMAHL